MNLGLAQRRMVEQQVRCWEVTDSAVLNVFKTVPREDFVPSGFRHLAYADTAIPLPGGQFMMTPIVEGRLLQSLVLGPNKSVLEIGAGSGFLTACLAKLAHSVASVDIDAELVAMAENNLDDAGVRNIGVQQMDATAELPAGQFDAIAVTASMPRFDERLLQALAPGGRLFAIVGDPPVMEARIYSGGADGDHNCETVFETSVAPLVNAPEPPSFVF